MRPSSLGGGRILRRTLSVRLSVRPSVCPSVPLADVVLLFYSRTVLRANIQNRKTFFLQKRHLFQFHLIMQHQKHQILLVYLHSLTVTTVQ